MKYSEFERWLIQQGAEIDKKHGKGSHRRVKLGDKETYMPYHGSREIPEPLRKAIIKQLGL